MYYKLLRVEEPKHTNAWYFRTFVYECEKCHKEYTRHTCNNRISPLCGKCSRELDRIKAHNKYLENKKELEYWKDRAKSYEKTIVKLMEGINNDK